MIFGKKNFRWLWAAFAVAVAFFIFYAFGAQRGMSWQDSGEFQYRVMARDLVWNSGIARAHPGYIMAASAFSTILGFISCGTIWTGFGTTLFSAFSMSVAIFFLFAIVYRATMRMDAALLASATLGCAHMAWWMASMAEVYASSLAFSMAEFYLLDAVMKTDGRRHIRVLCLLFLISGIHFSFHNFALLNLPVYIACILRRDRRFFREAVFGAMAFCIGSAPIIRLAAAEFSSGSGFAATLKSILFGTDYMGVVLGTSRPPLMRIVASYALASLSLLAPAWLLVAKGMRTCITGGALRRALAALTAIHALFWCRYFVADQATFIVPLLGWLAIWVGLGAAKMPPHKLRALLVASVAFQLVLPRCALHVAKHSELSKKVIAAKRAIPFRDEAAYWLLPWKRKEISAVEFTKAVLLEMPEGGTLFADSTTAPPLMMLRLAEGKTELGFRLATPWSKEPLPDPATTACFAVSDSAPYLPTAWRERHVTEKRGSLYKIEVGSDE